MSTDCDINVEGEIKWPLFPKVGGKLNFTVSSPLLDYFEHNQLNDQQKSGSAEVHYSGDNWTGHFSLGRSPGWIASCSYIQAITPALSLGGFARYDITKDSLAPAFAGVYDEGENMLAAKYDNSVSCLCTFCSNVWHQFHVLYLRRVNPNRVNISTDLVVGEDLSTTVRNSFLSCLFNQMTLYAEYILKQSKLNFSVDSNLFLKSMLETTITPGTSLQFSAEILHAKDHYRFGYGITMGGN